EVAVVGARGGDRNPAGGMPGRSRGELIALDQSDIAPACLGEMIENRAADDSSADHDGTIMRLHAALSLEAPSAITGSMPRSTSSGRWHMILWPGASSLIDGSSVSQMAPVLRGRRVWNGQPVGGFIGEGSSPLSTMCFLRTAVSAIGTADSSASV